MASTIAHSPRALMSVFAFTSAVLTACGGAESMSSAPAPQGTGGADGSAGVGGGSGGAVGAVTSAKPACTDPGPGPGGTPDPRADTAGALSTDGHAFVLFGGDTVVPVCGDMPKRTHVGDTWVLDTACGGWTEVNVTGGPAARARHAMALDAAHNRALLFGGRARAGATGPYTLFKDVWAFDFAQKAWSEVVTTGPGPTARYNAAMVVTGDRLLVFGGSTDTTGLSFVPKNDTYVLDLATSVWTKLAPSGEAPPARLFHSLAVDPTGTYAYVYSGGDQNAFTGPFLKDLWTLDMVKSTWTNTTPAKGDTDGAGRIKFGFSARAGEPGRPPVLFAFAGHDDGALGNRNDVITADLGAPSLAWASVRGGDVLDEPPSGACMFPSDFTKQDPASPERRSAFAFGASADGAAFVVVGGDSDCGRLSDAWWFDTTAGAWTPIRSSLPGLTCPRTGSTMCSSLCN